ncbi:MAG: pyridoxamine 5'-phosphate oxidase family protein [Methanomassiliicoccales archaeon]|jgi:nitroimidazol reductase NimA-like FMN-containing flavoprotein (pyridoxamine 5'-phosphate oxidase superfamily)|nr:pyridoxamine 5'-phosphate oxidase family protein [Methanomassiliicoccales archaeon]
MVMRRSAQEINDLGLIESVINEAKVCRIALCNDGEPYVVPLSFGYSNGHIYLHSAEGGKKVEMMRKNNRVCFEIDVDIELIESNRPCGFEMSYLSVIGFGTASFITDVEKKKEALQIIMEHYTGQKEYEFDQKVLEKTLIIAISIERMTGKRSEKVTMRQGL